MEYYQKLVNSTDKLKLEARRLNRCKHTENYHPVDVDIRLGYGSSIGVTFNMSVGLLFVQNFPKNIILELSASQKMYCQVREDFSFDLLRSVSSPNLFEVADYRHQKLLQYPIACKHVKTEIWLVVENKKSEYK